MFKISLDEYKETKIYFQLFDVLLKNLDITKETYLIENGITPSSYRLARKQEQNIGKLISYKICENFKYIIPDELKIIEIEEKFNKIYFDMYYKIYDNYQNYLNYVNDLLKENLIIFPILKLLKIFIVANSVKDAGEIVRENINEFDELKKYVSFFNDTLNEIFEILSCAFNDINVNDYIMKKFQNGLFYYAISSKCLDQKKYMECLHFSNKCKEILLEEGNYKRLIYLNLKMMNCLTHFKRYEECYNLSKNQLLMAKSFDINGYEKFSTYKHYITSAFALERYEEIVVSVKKQETISQTELIAFLISSYVLNKQEYEELKNYYKNIFEKSNPKNESALKLLEIIEDYIMTGNKKRIYELKASMLTLLDILRERDYRIYKD